MEFTGPVNPDPSLGEVCSSLPDLHITGDPAVYPPPGGGAPHIFVRGTAGNLLEFIPDNVGGRLWNAYDHTADTGKVIYGDPAVYAPPGGGAPHIYVRGGPIRGTAAHLLEFIPDNVGGRLWNAYDHTIDTGEWITGEPAVYAPPGGGAPHIYVRGTGEILLEFIPDNVGGRLWNAYDHTIDTGEYIAGDPAVYAPPGGGAPHIYVRGTTENLLEFIPDNVGGRLWNAYDHTADTGKRIIFDPAVYAAPGDVPRVYVGGGGIRGTATHLLEFIPDNVGGRLWNAYDHTIGTGEWITGEPAVYAPPGGGAPHIYVRGTTDNLLEFIPDNVGGRLWNAYDHTIDTGVHITGESAVFTQGGIPHVFVRGTTKNLLEFIPDNMRGRLWNAYDHTTGPAGPVIDQSVYALPPSGQVVVADPTPDPSAPVTCPQVTSSDNAFAEWRLLQGLRSNAAFPGRNFDQPLPMNPPPVGWDERNPLGTLTNAAFLLAGNPVEAMAMADLAVTGRMSYEALAARSFQTSPEVVAVLVADGASQDAATQVVARAQKVAWAIRGSPSWRATLRPQLGWIGVSGEDDAPHRPCNVASLPGPQFDIEVPDIPVVSGTLTVKTRIAIAESPWPTPTTVMPGNPPSFLPPDDTPTVSPDCDYVFLYMAGDCSRAEEANDMIPALLWAAGQHGKRASVIAFDMIGWGYSARKSIRRRRQPGAVRPASHLRQRATAVPAG
jgi:hypothetical protein